MRRVTHNRARRPEREPGAPPLRPASDRRDADSCLGGNDRVRGCPDSKTRRVAGLDHHRRAARPCVPAPKAQSCAPGASGGAPGCGCVDFLVVTERIRADSGCGRPGGRRVLPWQQAPQEASPATLVIDVARPDRTGQSFDTVFGPLIHSAFVAPRGSRAARVPRAPDKEGHPTGGPCQGPSRWGLLVRVPADQVVA
jgi:hypothetical protein